MPNETQKPIAAEWAKPQSRTVTPAAGAIVREEAGSMMMEVRADVGVAALAAQAEAMVKARWALAKMNPRDVEQVRTRLLKDCLRPGFADGAIYSKPVGGGKPIEGASVRFAEALMRHMGNMLVEAIVVLEDQEKRIVQVSVTDLETVATDSVQVVIAKTVERKGDGKGPPKDRIVLGERLNSYGEKTYLVAATEDEMLNKTNSAISKARRNKIIEMAPYDVVEEAKVQCHKTLAVKDAADPDAAKRKLIDSFATLSIDPADLQAFLGHPLEKVTPKDLDDLRKAYFAVRDGEATWASILESRGAVTTKSPAGATTAPPPAPVSKPAPAEKPPAPPHDPVTGEVKDDPFAGGGDPDSFTDKLMADMQRAADTGDAAQLRVLAGKAEQVPHDLQEQVSKVYAACKAQLKAGGPK